MNVDTYPHGGGPVVSGRGGTAIVIGSGFGGLAAAIRLSVRGWRVQVLERLPVPGGRARVHEQDGFRFDAGPTIITVPAMAPPVASALAPAAPVSGADAAGKSRRSTSA